MHKKIDVVIISVTILDSPLIRDFIHKYYNFFNSIYYIFTYNNETYPDGLVCSAETPYTEFIKSDLKGKCKFITRYSLQDNSLYSDWRDSCMQDFLNQSTGDYILSLEPDVSLDWDKALDIINKKSFKFMSVWRERFWPCFWLCKKELLDNLKYKTFSAFGNNIKQQANIVYNKKITYIDNKFEVIDVNEQDYDHFNLISTQIVDKIDKNDILLLDNEGIWWEHYSGITQGYVSMVDGDDRYKKFYNRCINHTSVNLLNIWKDRSLRIINENI